MGKVARILVLLLTLFCSVRAMADDPKWFPEEQVVAFPEGKTFDFGDILQHWMHFLRALQLNKTRLRTLLH